MDSKKFIKLGALLLIIFAALTITISVVNLTSTLAELSNMNSEDAALIDAQLRQEGTDLDSALVVIKVVAYITLAVGSILSVIKIIVGVLILKKTERTHKFYMTWSVIFIIFGLWAVKSVGFTMLGLSHLISGLAAPALLIVGSIKLKKETEAAAKDFEEPLSE